MKPNVINMQKEASDIANEGYEIKKEGSDIANDAFEFSKKAFDIESEDINISHDLVQVNSKASVIEIILNFLIFVNEF